VCQFSERFKEQSIKYDCQLMLLVVIHWRGEQTYLNINQANNVIMPYRLQDRYLRFQIFKELSCQFLFQDGLDCDRSIRCL
jgi:hypothetical protein